MSRYNNGWTKEELDFINNIKNKPNLYKERNTIWSAKGQVSPLSKRPIFKVWESIAKTTNMSVYQCISKWECWKECYISLRKQQLNGKIVVSKYLDGTFSFLDDEMKELKQFRMKKGNTTDKQTKRKTVTVLSLSNIDQLLKERNDDPDIDSATVHYLFNILTDHIELAMKSNTCGTKLPKRSKVTDTPETLKNIETTQIAKSSQIEQTPQVVEPSSSNNNPNRKLIIKQPYMINMESLISALATDALQSTSTYKHKVNKVESPEPHLVSERTGNESQQTENQIIEVDDGEIDQTKCSPRTSNIIDNTQSHVVDPKTTKSAKKQETNTVFDLHCSQKDTRLFFQDLAVYLINKFSPAKLKELRLQICSLITEAELAEME